MADNYNVFEVGVGTSKKEYRFVIRAYAKTGGWSWFKWRWLGQGRRAFDVGPIAFIFEAYNLG